MLRRCPGDRKRRWNRQTALPERLIRLEEPRMTRRTIFNSTAGLLASALVASGQKPADILPGAEKKRKLKVVFVGAHVDDWGGCAGTLARYAREGHDVICFSFTPGDSE